MVRGKKLALEIDSSKILVYVKNASDVISVKSRLLASNKVTKIDEVSVGKRKPLELKIEKTSYKNIVKFTASVSQIEYTFPLYKAVGKNFYFTNEIILQPKDGILIQNILLRN